ncbi:MAG: orotidine-5'-phosphate decarboxylase [Bacteroidales bacterium]
MHRSELVELIRHRRSYLCVGLDTDLEKIPPFLHQQSEDPVFEFNRRIIDATIDLAVAYKPNMAFYESMGSKGWKSLEKTVTYLRSLSKPAFIIADAKRGDIGNSAGHYAKAFFETMDFDAVTVNPYMGEDTIQPFLQYPGKWAVVLAITSNAGSKDFQVVVQSDPSAHERLYERVMQKCMEWGSLQNLMFVVGATQSGIFDAIRQKVPDHFFLVPGVGAQGGSLEDVSRRGLTPDAGLLVNASRSILYCSQNEDFDLLAHQEAARMQKLMESLLKEKNII